ncbi:MAG: hypothetical protein WD470_03585 [Rhodospirillaceae bacterium]
MARCFLALAVVMALAAPISGCGKKPRDLDAPEGGKEFPRTYPTSR